ncbi:hypothetical protein [Flavobacterium sp. DG2-3]|uniref:hypothetical protein n=1 Tax=Flavobacterium sp. DG2-3 TaxID=3068317 RepID=UPI00273D37AF|nr:hypothetical protein [Flavobacterium sp. DG2-3]MDP5199810.1 hypothetical protein [Flavobacterium sp. DG2-3]
MKKNNEINSEPNLEDEKENSALRFIFFLVVIGICGIALFVCNGFTRVQGAKVFAICATLFFIAGAAFVLTSMIGFLFGIPRTTVIAESEKSKSRYIGNDNLLQVSDWLTKIILGLGLTQIHEMAPFLKKTAIFMRLSTQFNNDALIVLIIIYNACLGFLFGYLWTRLYFIRMLKASDSDINNVEETSAQINTHITTDIKTGVTTAEEK